MQTQLLHHTTGRNISSTYAVSKEDSFSTFGSNEEGKLCVDSEQIKTF